MLGLLTRLLNKHPISGPILSAGVLTFTGDAIAQHCIEKVALNKHDWARSCRQTSYGLFFIGPGACIWFRFLDSHIRHASLIKQTLVRVGLDQLLFTPFTLMVYFVYNSKAEGCSWQGARQRLRNSYSEALKANYILWPWVQTLNFTIIPLNYRVIFVNLVAIGWNAYLSNLNAKKIKIH